ncbi:MAG: hypothetical protein ABSH08_19185 [Tepidisphaeraceae bacterium]|jgi:hypothetical protein
MSHLSKPQVFIIESLGLDEEKDLREGERIQKMIGMSGKKCKYFYIRTKLEFRKILNEFQKSEHRYLHLSCHGGKQGEKRGLWTTFDHLDFDTLGRLLRPHINQRRVFVSACGAASMSLASSLMTNTKCHSVMRPYNNIGFSDAALFWATFYHLMFRENGPICG